MKLEGREVKRRQGRFVDRIGAEARAVEESSGRVVEIAGELELVELQRIAGIILVGQAGSGAEARRYYLGRGARVEDPRTGAGTPRYKDVLRGELDLFIAAWFSRAPSEPVTAPLS